MFYHLLTRLFLAVLLVGLAGHLQAQPLPGDGVPDVGPAAPADETDLAVQQILDSNPQTPEELMRAVDGLLQLNRPKIAQRFVQQLIDAKLRRADLALLVRRFGSGLFVRLQTDERLDPATRQFGEDALQAAHLQSRDPAFIARVIKALNDPDPKIRGFAAVDIRDSGEAAVGPLLNVLIDKDREEEHPRVQAALISLGDYALDPLLGVLEVPDDSYRAQAILALAGIRSRRSLPYLVGLAHNRSEDVAIRYVARVALKRILGGVPSQPAAEAYLFREARKYFAGERPPLRVDEGQVELWRWDPKRKRPVPVSYPVEDASLILAGHFASDLYELDPEDKRYRRLYLAAILEAAKVENGIDQPLPRGAGTAHAKAAAVGRDALEDILLLSMENERFLAAVGAAEVLGDLRDPRSLASEEGKPGPLIRALRHTNRRLRFAAAEAIMKIDRTTPYAGASFLPETLGYLAGSGGVRRALIADPRRDTAQSLAGMLQQLGFEADTVTTGRALVSKARRSPDYEFVLVSELIDDARVWDTIQLLRRDRRTARLPVGILAEADRLQQNKTLAERDELTVAFYQPITRQGMAGEVARMMKLLGRDLVSFDERRVQAIRALQWLGEIAGNRKKYYFYNVLRHQDEVLRALYDPVLSMHAAAVLAMLGTPKAQQALIDLASQNVLPLSRRRAAATAFRIAVGRRHLQLSRAAILRQYDRYNQSENLSKETQQVLGGLLDTIEGKFNSAAAPSQGEDGNG